MLTDGGGKKVPLPLNLSHISYNDELGTVILYLRKTQNIYKSRDTLLELC